MAPADICRPGGTTSACAENTIGHMREQRAHRNYLRVRGEYSSKLARSFSSRELPPRARRILTVEGFAELFHGTTSACAENTPILCRFQTTIRNYLRVRGEYTIQMNSSYKHRELPPRARRILCTTADFCDVFGTTSACAENTNGIPLTTLTRWNYLRVRGEYFSRRRPSYVSKGTTSACAENTHPHHPAAARPGNYLRVRGEYPKTFYLRVWLLELPPRARRIPAEVTADPRTLGTTSACAENTMPTIARVRQSWNYLRVRGEYLLMGGVGAGEVELPPRARRIHTLTTLPRHGRGTTSACAENTHALRRGGDRPRNYLRVRGEYHRRSDLQHICMELPPRARRILPPKTTRDSSTGTTSACAENTAKMQDTTGRPWNYLRVRGEYGEPHMPFDETRELPPRARRIRASRNNMKHITRTTSACAENTKNLSSRGRKGGNYLRVRGEYPHHSYECWFSGELPPRARRIRGGRPASSSKTGTTSACAENT